MKLKFGLIIGLLLLLGGACSAWAKSDQPHEKVPPILIIVVDKLDSIDVFQSELPGMKRLVRESSTGLMSICSGSGYTNTNSGYLTLGSGTRCSTPDPLVGLMKRDELVEGIPAQDFWSWVMSPVEKTNFTGLAVPEIGLVDSFVQQSNSTILPGSLGTCFRENGWRTVVYSNNDRFEEPARPGGLLMMDRLGLVDDGRVDAALTVTDPQFPYLKRIDPDRAARMLKTVLKPRRVVMLDYDDFARLSNYREKMLDRPYQQAKQATLRRLDQLLLSILKQWSVEDLSLVVVSPSNSLEALNQKHFLAPIIIRAVGYQAGVLSSGTTKWLGITSNIDFLPTIIKLAQLSINRNLDGRPMQAQPQPDREQFISTLHQRINAALAVQRPIINQYLTLITIGWLVGWVGSFLKFWKFSEWFLDGVAVIPLVLILMPLLPPVGWQVSIFLTLIGASTILLRMIPEYRNRYLVLAATTWAVLTIDQIAGWKLIRYSGLGYSAAAGARFYGMGNEFMGIFLPLALLTSELIYQKTKQRWPALLILGFSILVLGWPQLGINFGGTLAALVGFFFYLFRLYHWDLRNKKLWLAIGGGIVIILVVGFWDSLRAAEQQSHIGRFFGLIFSRRFGEILIIIGRKIEMNLKLITFSPWARMVWLALGITLFNRFLTKRPLFTTGSKRVGQAMLVAGLAAFVFNDSGVVALATGLAFSFSYLLMTFQKEKRPENEG